MLKASLGKLQQESPGLWPGTEWPGKAGRGSGLERVGGGRGSSRTQWAKPVRLWVGFSKTISWNLDNVSNNSSYYFLSPYCVPGSALSILPMFPHSSDRGAVGVPISQISKSRYRVMKCLAQGQSLTSHPAFPVAARF